MGKFNKLKVVITEKEVELPSMGKFYGDDKFDGVVSIKPMTVNQQKKFLSVN